MIDLKAIPDALKEGENWPLLDLDPDWVWVSYDKAERIVGILIAAPCHGIVLLWRVKMLPSAPIMALLRLFRSFIRDLRKRHCLGYIVMLDATRPDEQALARIAFRAGALAAPGSFSLVAGSVNTKHVGEK